MHIITLRCSNCGTVVAANVLEDNRRMKCPGLDCDTILAYEDLPKAEREYFDKHREQYQM